MNINARHLIHSMQNKIVLICNALIISELEHKNLNVKMYTHDTKNK